MAADKHRPHNAAEFAKLQEWARGARSILEIGSRYGFALLDLAAVAAPGARIVAVDLPGAGDWGEPDSMSVLYANVAELRKLGFDAHVIIGDSVTRSIRDQVDKLRPINFWQQFDFGFIDGDHRYNGARADWINYGGMCRQVAFHDIVQPRASENQNLEVWRLWQEIKEDYETEEFVAPDSKMGVGLVSPRIPKR